MPRLDNEAFVVRHRMEAVFRTVDAPVREAFEQRAAALEQRLTGRLREYLRDEMGEPSARDRSLLALAGVGVLLGFASVLLIVIS